MQTPLIWKKPKKTTFSQKPCSVTYGDTACASKGAPKRVPLAQGRTWSKTIRVGMISLMEGAKILPWLGLSVCLEEKLE